MTNILQLAGLLYTPQNVSTKDQTVQFNKTKL